jgi:hypothetical protein
MALLYAMQIFSSPTTEQQKGYLYGSRRVNSLLLALVAVAQLARAGDW